MTFKHIDFGSSPVMRSFEKVAFQKGLVNEEDLTISFIREKVAKIKSDKEKDLYPSNNLTVDILKLCNGLKNIGLETYANEVEQNFIRFKQANSSLYDISGESGEDVINSAHPGGSHKLENLPGDEATIETILDKHLKNLEVINKKPTGKLSNAADIIQAVKLIFAQQTLEDKSKENTSSLGMLKGYILDIAALFQAAIKQTDIGWFDKKRLNPSISQIMEYSNNPSASNIEEVSNLSKWIYGSLKNILEDNQDTWKEISSQLNRVWSTLAIARKLRSEIDNPQEESKPIENKSVEVTQPAAQTFDKSSLIGKLNSIKNKIKYYTSLVPLRISPKFQANPLEYLGKWDADASNKIEYISSIPDEEMSANGQELNAKISELNGWVANFGKQWLKE